MALTYADLAAFPEDNVRRELLDGELIVSPSPITIHQVVVGNLYVAFRRYLDENGGGRVFVALLDVVLSDINVLEPDVIFVARAQLDIIDESNIKGVPALVIEVLSNPRIDRVRKREIYQRFGVPEYWIADPDSERVEVYRLDGEHYAKPEIFDAGDTLPFASLPGFEIDVRALFTMPRA